MSDSVRFIVESQSISPENTQEAHPAVNAVANACLKEIFGETAILNPNTITVQPMVKEYIYTYAIHSWHELGSAANTGRLQYNESIFCMLSDQQGAYLVTEADETIRISEEQSRCFAAIYLTGMVGMLLRKLFQPPDDFQN